MILLYYISNHTRYVFYYCILQVILLVFISDHRVMHKDGGNSTCSHPNIVLFGLDKLVCLKMCLQSELSLRLTHNSVLSSHIHWMHSIREYFILPGHAYTPYISKRQPRTWDNFIWIHITSVTDATLLNITEAKAVDDHNWWGYIT